MPRIELKPYKTYNDKKVYRSKGNNLIHQLVYNTGRWREMRVMYLMKQPICEVCKKEFAVEVHHKIPISTGVDRSEILKLGFDADNLMALCSNCHRRIHND
ncbi:MAG TPA: HNH endonuclease signature motif containing protein [Candidatus Dojkabacteria bacterium]|nr:HNH endonuclease signature motif containing protein [Candidatus Dojkabacteria bacterium]